MMGRRLMPVLPGMIVAQTKQNLAQLQAASGAHHDRLAAIEAVHGSDRPREPSHVTHEAVANQVTRPSVHHVSLDHLRPD